MPLRSRPSTRMILARALLLGIAAGIRSIVPLAMLARHQPDAPRPAGWRAWPVLRSRAGRMLLQLAWAGEFVADKLPIIPPRTNLGPLTGRIVLGALAGLAIGTERRGLAPKACGAAAGGMGAIIGAYGGYHARTLVTETTGLLDAPVAVVGDIGAAALARTAVRG